MKQLVTLLLLLKGEPNISRLKLCAFLEKSILVEKN